MTRIESTNVDQNRNLAKSVTLGWEGQPVMGFGHFYVAIVLSMNNEYLNLFVYADELPFSVKTRYLLYSWGVIAGFVVGVLFIDFVSADSAMEDGL